MADEGRNIRSVIKNTTMGGMGVKGSGDTIATKEEITQSKEKPETPKMSAGPKLGLQTPSLGGLSGGLNLKKAQGTGKSEVVSQPKVEQGIQSTEGGVSVSQMPQVSNPFQNVINQPINNINVEQFNNEEFKPKESGINLRKAERIDNRLKELPKDIQKRMSKGVENLYIDAYNKSVNGGQLTIEEVLGNKNYQQQLKGIDENVLASMIEDANFLAGGEYDTNNVLALMDKYQDLGLKMDLDNLPPETKAQYISAMMNDNDGGLGGLVDKISPLNIPGEAVELATGKNPRDYNQKLQQWAEENKQDFLTDEELGYMIEDQVKNLDKEYKDYYYNQTEEMFTDKRIGEQFYKDVAKLRKENKDMSEEEAVATVMKEGKYNGTAYEKFPHETVDQGRFWSDKEREKEYNKRLKELEKGAKEAHGDTGMNWVKNLGLDAVTVISQGVDLVRNPGALVQSLFGVAKGGVHKAIEGYADLLDTWVATTESAIGAIKGENEWEGIQYRVGEVGEKVAKKKGYENYDAMVERMERESEDNPALGVATWFLKQGQKDVDTANALGDYLKASYGSLESAEQMAKENPVQLASDIISVIQLGTMGAAKMGLIDAKKAEDIVRIAGYGDLYEQTLKWGNKLQFGPVLRGEMAIAKAGGKVVGAPLKIGKNVVEVFVNRLSGLTKEERDFIRKNPEKVEEFLSGDKNSQTLLDRIKERFDGLQLDKKLEGEEYEKIRNSNKPVKISDMLSGISERLKKAGLELTNEGVKVNKNYTPALNQKFTELGNFLDELRNKGNSATAEDVWWARRQIDTLAKWDGVPAGLEADALNVIRDVRGILDNQLKRQVPDLKGLDESYRATKNEIKELKQDWFDKDGNLRDMAYSRIRNLTKQGANQPKLARLEKLLPGISEELRGLAVAESVEKAGKQMVGQYASQIFGVGGGIAAITGLLSGGFSAGPLILGALGATLATPKNLVKLLKFQGNVSKGFNGILDKITNGVKLSPKETLEFTKYLNDNQDALKKDAEYMYRKGLITDEEYKQALKNKEKEGKEVKKTGNIEKKDNTVKEKEEPREREEKREGLKRKEKADMGKKIETVQETPNGLKKKKEWSGKIKTIWEETINPDTQKPYTEEEVNVKMNKIKDKYLNDKNKLRKLYNQYVKINNELDKDLQQTFMKDGYINPDGLRPLINKEFAKELGVSDNVMASTNHPAVKEIADAFVDMVGDDMVEKAKKGDKVNVALIGGGGGSGKSGGPKAMISEGFVKDGEKVDMTLDVQGGANDLQNLIEKARREGVLDNFNFKIAYVYASTEDAGKGVINRTINQNQRILENQGLSPKMVEKETDIGKNRLYAGRTLPFEVFEKGHLKSVGEKGLRGYINIAKDVNNVEFMITERIPGDRKNTKKYIVKQGGEWKMTEKELNDLAERMTKNKEAGLNWKKLQEEGQKAVKEGKISKRQYANLFGRLGAFAFLLMVLSGGSNQEA